MSFIFKKNILLLLLLFPYWMLAQVTIKGTIKDKATGAPIETAYIFIANTNLGTISDRTGHFVLSNIPTGKVNIVISHLSYRAFSKQLSFLQGAEYDWKIKLEADVVGLADIEVKTKSSKKRKKYIKRFTQAFLGRTPNAKLCHLRNPEVLRFEEKKNILRASAKDLLQIENFALGYRLFFHLEKFQLKGKDVSYQGKPLFEELIPKSASQKKTWIKNRAESYRGSLAHFYRTVMEGTTEEEGFKTYKAKLNASKVFELSTPVNIKTLVTAQSKTAEKWLSIPDFLKVVYTLETDELSAKINKFNMNNANLGRPAEREMMLHGSNDVKENVRNQQSYLFSLLHLIKLDENARPAQTEMIKEYGYWSYERVAEMLPMTYQLPTTAKLKVPVAPSPTLTKAADKNGFSLEQLRIPKSEIKAGGPPKDGIPAIDRPHFVPPSQVDFLEEEDEVLSVVINGKAKAYPIKILNFHELVNDQIDDQAVLISYCPLCNSGIVFSRALEGQVRSFGVSGLLYNSDVLLYDRETESLWSQIMGQAVAGKASGQKLQIVVSSRLRWGTWKEQFPDGQVLSTQTGFIKDYQHNPYAKYENSKRLMFPVAKESKALARKAKVLGLVYQGKYRAYPLKRLRKHLRKKKSPLIDRWQAQEIRIYFDEDQQVSKVENQQGRPLVATQMYWFAWYAFHPTTSIYERP